MKKQSLTDAYVIMFDHLPPQLEMMDFEDDFYQELMGNALISGEPITEEIIERALEEKKIQYDTAEKPLNDGFSNFEKK